MNSKINKLVAIVMTIICIVLLIVCAYQSREKTQLDQMVIALGDSLKQSTNEIGELQSSKSIIMGTVDMLHYMVNSQDSVIRVLSGKVNKKTIGVGLISQEIADTIVIPADTVYLSSPCDTIERRFQLQDDWGRYRIDLRSNRAMLAYEIQNRFTVDMSWKKQGLFKPSIPLVTVTDHNPHSRTSQVEFLMVGTGPPRKKIWVVMEKIGIFGAGAVTGYAAAKL